MPCDCWLSPPMFPCPFVLVVLTGRKEGQIKEMRQVQGEDDAPLAILMQASGP